MFVLPKAPVITTDEQHAKIVSQHKEEIARQLNEIEREALRPKSVFRNPTNGGAS